MTPSKNSDFENLLNSVVKIDVWEVSQKDGGSQTNRSIGSGVIMSEDGMVLTNAHVVNCYATQIVVTLANLERVHAMPKQAFPNDFLFRFFAFVKSCYLFINIHRILYDLLMIR